ncbi:MAG: hypothetical protein K2K47_06530 [Duncaniella sp.]|nr:hypothetical protein [Duncaniella sp.]
MNISSDAIYWIFSTLPQVLAALAGLVMTGLTVYDQNLSRRIDEDPSREDILQPIVDGTFRRGRKFFVFSIVCILLDVGVLAYAEKISKGIAEVSVLGNGESIVWLSVFLLLLVGNCYTLWLLMPILNVALSKKDRSKIIAKETDETKKALDAEEQSPDSKNGVKTPDESDKDGDDTLSPMIFIEYFRRLENAVKAYFPEVEGFTLGRRASMAFMVGQLCKDNIIPRDYENELKNIIKLRNLYIHGAEIGYVSKKVIDRLKEVTDLLTRNLPGNYMKILGPKAEEWRKWINEYASDNKDKDNLIETVTTNASHGKYHILINGYHVTVKPKLPDGSSGERLTVSHNDVQEFIRYLDMLRNE